METVKCEDCENFSRNQIGCPINGMGQCKEWQKIEVLNLPFLQHKEQWRRFGNKCFWPRVERKCEFFKSKE